MGQIKLIILISALVTLSQPSFNYRLPKDSVPYHYNLKFVPHISPGNFTFDGESEIFLEVLQTTKNLTLHSSNLKIHKEKTTLIRGEEIFVPDEHIYEEESHFLILNFLSNLKPGNYSLHLKYTGEINKEPQGFFQTSYVNDNNETIYLVATNFEPTFARQAFPCWDEPALKAAFDISINHFPNYTALSNMLVKKKIIETEIDGKIRTDFDTTLRMSTYLVAFTVSDFVNITNAEGNFSVWSRKSALDSMKFGFDVGLKAFPILEKYTNIPYMLPKMDLILVPTFIYGAMENWGLVIFLEYYFLRNSSSSQFQNLTTSKYVVHELAHQWFGNLVSPAWWNDLWLTEGLATYLQYFLTAKVIDVPRFMEYFVVQSNFEVFIEDEKSSSLPLYWDINTEKEALDHLNIVHYKAAAIMHMLNGLISEDVFHAGVRKLLQIYQFQTITTDDFWKTMQETLNKFKLPNKFNVKMVMDTYISQIGYPVINVIRDYTTGTINLTQECPACLENKNNNTESRFWIPINFATKSSPNFSSTFATRWMNPEQKELIIEGVDPDDWIIFNIQSSAYYRVNYDETNWKKLADYLNSDEFSKIHPVNRAQLLKDSFSLFKQKKFDKNLFMYLTSYLKQEVDLIPWEPADNILIYLLENIDMESFKKIVVPRVDALFKETGEDDNDGDDFFTIYKRSIATYWKCNFDRRSCKRKH